MAPSSKKQGGCWAMREQLCPCPGSQSRAGPLGSGPRWLQRWARMAAANRLPVRQGSAPQLHS